jgi:predicted dehydrogenase
MFTKNILLPALKRIAGIKLQGVATTTGVTSQHIAKKFGFAYATTDYQAILQDDTIHRVIITTRHNLHANLVIEALTAGKHVFVEKPLCLTEDELDKIIAAYDGTRLLMVGFNRRFAPLARQVKDAVSSRSTPIVMSYRVNAGYIPPEHWVHDPETGGGRLKGEVCHFIDFLLYMAGSDPVQLNTESIGGSTGKYLPEDNLIITLTCKDGSLGNIIYTAKGPKSFSRERFEVFCEDSVAVIEDFKSAQIVKGGRTRKLKKLSMDMGYNSELEFFFRHDPQQVNYHEFFATYINSTLATLRAAQSLQNRGPA